MELGENQFVSIDYLSLGKQTAQKYVNKTNKRDENLKLYSTKISYSNMENKIVGSSNVKFRYLESLILTTAESTREMMNTTTKNIVANLDVVTDKFVEFNIRLKAQILENSQKTIRQDQINYARIIKTIMVNSIAGQIISLDLFKSQEMRADDRQKYMIERYKVLGDLVIDQISDLKDYVSEEFDSLTEKTEDIAEAMLEISDQFTQLSNTYQTLMGKVGAALTNLREVVADRGVDFTRLETLVLKTRTSLQFLIADSMTRAAAPPIPDPIGAAAGMATMTGLLYSDYKEYQAGELKEKKPKLEEFDFTIPPSAPAPAPAALSVNNARDQWIKDHPRIVAARKATGQPDVPPYVEDRIKRRAKKAAKKPSKAKQKPAQLPLSSPAQLPLSSPAQLPLSSPEQSPPVVQQPAKKNNKTLAEEAIKAEEVAMRARREAAKARSAAAAIQNNPDAKAKRAAEETEDIRKQLEKAQRKVSKLQADKGRYDRRNARTTGVLPTGKQRRSSARVATTAVSGNTKPKKLTRRTNN